MKRGVGIIGEGNGCDWPVQNPNHTASCLRITAVINRNNYIIRCVIVKKYNSILKMECILDVNITTGFADDIWLLAHFDCLVSCLH